MRYHKSLILAVMLPCSVMLQGCFTGIEGTKTISLSRDDEKQTVPTPEERLLDEIKGTPLSQWVPGKRFIAAGSRSILTFNSSDAAEAGNPDLKGETLSFSGTSVSKRPDGTDETILIFSYNGFPLRYSSGKSPEEAGQSITSDKIPMLIDPLMVSAADSLLDRRVLFIKTPLWYDSSRNRLQGRKFIPVTIDSVSYGDAVFPLEVFFTDDKGRNASVLMNFNSDGAGSRTFQSLFSISDIRAAHKSISPENWELITQSRTAPGMTKEECRLALGSPEDAASGQDPMRTLDIWQYPDGTFLRFENGILIEPHQ